MSRKSLKIYFYVFDLIGPQNSCIGFGQTLIKNGHDVYFMVNAQFAGNFSKFGIKEHILEPASITDDKNTIDEVCEMMCNFKIFDPAPPIETLRRTKCSNFYKIFYENWCAFEPQIKEIIARDKPDLLIVDSDIAPPSLVYAPVPFVYLFCSNPLGILDSPNLPAFTSGLCADDDPKLWREYYQERRPILDDEAVKYQTMICEKFGYPPLKSKTIVPVSPFFNLIQYPAELSYEDIEELPSNFYRVDTFVRFEPEEFKIPEKLSSQMKAGDKLIYLSLGSMGCCNRKLMQRLIKILSGTRHFYIVSEGQLANQYELAENMWGAQKVPQTKVLPLVDLFITHGGNNSLMESFYFGKPVILFPQFYDQFDNGTRVQEKKYGYTFNHNNFTDQELLNAIETMLNDPEIKEKYEKISKRIQSENRSDKACRVLEQRLEEFNKTKL